MSDHAANGAATDDPPALGFVSKDGRYSMTAEGGAIEFELDYLRRDAHQLKGELLVRCFVPVPGVHVTNGVLTVADFNISSTRTRNEMVKHLVERSGLKDLAWADYVEDFCQRVLAADRCGQPPVVLSSVPRPVADREVEALGLTLPWRHPSVLFGDGGSTKSMLALAFASHLARRGLVVLYADWELDEGEQRDRQERLCGLPLPPVLYLRCTRSLVHEADIIHRLVRQEGIDYIIFDSIAFACDGPPESAESAIRYFQALRYIGAVGSLHLAHVSKALEGADMKPFGSSFWHNGFRSTWNIKRSDGMPGEKAVRVALHNRKENCGPIRGSLGYELSFSSDRTLLRPLEVEAVPELAAGLPIRQLLRIALRNRGLVKLQTLAEELGHKADSIRRTAARYPKEFNLVENRIALTSAFEVEALKDVH